MNTFDTLLVAPTREQLDAVLAAAVDALGREMPHGSAYAGGPRFDATAGPNVATLWKEQEADREGHRSYPLGTSEYDYLRVPVLDVVWWRDYLARRHVRVTGRMPSHATRGPRWEPPHPPLARIYPEYTSVRFQAGEGQILVHCGCGAAGTPEAVGWMGTGCAPCFDREASDVPPSCHWRDHQSPIVALTVSPDGRRLASAEESGPVLLRDLATGTVVERLDGSGLVAKLAFRPGGSDLRVVRTDQWGVPECFAFAPGGGMFTCRRGNRHIHLDGGSELTRLPVPDGLTLIDLAVSPDGQHLVACAGDKGNYLWHVPSGRLLNQFGYGKRIPPLAFSPDGRYLGMPNNAGVYLYDFESDRSSSAGTDRGAFQGYVFGPDSTWMVAAHEQSLNFCDLDRTVTVRRTVVPANGRDDPLRALALTPDGQWLVIGRQSGAVALWPVGLLTEG